MCKVLPYAFTILLISPSITQQACFSTRDSGKKTQWKQAMDDLDALLAELEQTTESLSLNDSDPNVCFLLERDNKPKPVAAITESHPTQHPKSTPQEAKKLVDHKYFSFFSKILPPQQTSSTSIAQELDDLLACLGTIQSKVSDDLASSGQSTSAEGNTTDNLDSMLKSLTDDMQDLGVATVPKGNCAFCHKPIVGKKILTAMDQTWHPEHFFCTHCGTVFGDGGYHVKDGKPYCQKDFQSIFSPKCRGCDRPVMNQYLSALNAVWHPECFVCRDCCCSFTDGSFFELKGQPYCELHFHHHQGTVCHGCGKPIVGRCVSAMGHKFHPEHFVCAFCLTQLHNGIFQEQNGKTYCHSCFKKLFV
ncbi:LPXN: Leupaxin [Crotalus adamanteus]|uniref:LPXN: Leupaxin n=1 Tax=Crotalus adamanteus TaxID=8729 RepID=A0AAW1C709_CROAD